MIYELEIKEQGFEGVAKIEIPSFTERMKIVKETEIKDGQTLSELDKVVQLVDIAKSKTKEIKVSHGKLTIDKIEDLEMYQEGLQVIYKIAGVVINGISLGNSH